MADMKEGEILARVIIEVAGKPKEHIENTLRNVVNRIKNEEKNIRLKQGDLYKAKEVEITTEHKGQFWSTFAELELIFNNLQTLIAFCFVYMPSSVEILKPEDISFNIKEFSDLLTELLAKLHSIGLMMKEQNAKMELLNKNAASLLRNIIMIVLRNKEKDIEEIAKISGIEKDKLKPFIDEFVKGGLLKEANGKYSLIK